MNEIIAQFPRFAAATWLTIWMFCLVSTVSTLLGVMLGVCAHSGGRIASGLITAYTSVFRGLPELVVLLACYLALPVIGIDLGSIGSALLGFTLIATAFHTEIFRGGLAAIDTRLLEAARALGMSWPLMMRRIVLPQVIRIAVPAWATFLAANIKMFALASAVAVTDIMAVTRQAMAVSSQPFTIIIFAGLIYAIIASALMIMEMFISRRMTRKYGPIGE